jgi:FMN phosphatase YigB (HAD superfamily)
LGGKDLAFDQVKQAWNALLIGMPAESVALLRSLKQAGYRLYLLSNTNIFHFNAINLEMQEKFGIRALAELFDHSYYSFEVGMRKPDREIYQKVLDDHNLDPARTIFIDDNAENISASRALGIASVQKRKEEPLQDLLRAAGIF